MDYGVERIGESLYPAPDSKRWLDILKMPRNLKTFNRPISSDQKSYILSIF